MEAALRAAADTIGCKAKDSFVPAHTLVTGREATPPLFTTMEVRGKERCRRRLRNAITPLEVQGKAAAKKHRPLLR